ISLQVIHRDLAARNVLLAENFVVKICDFGLARNLYMDNQYRKKGDEPLPIKWMALESLTEDICTSKSDVWAYGVTLWEMFSFGKPPYPGMDRESLIAHLQGNRRLETPEYANKHIYQIMEKCWNLEPSRRPSFPTLSRWFCGMMTETERQVTPSCSHPAFNRFLPRLREHIQRILLQNYNELTAPFLEMNKEYFQTNTDFLELLSPGEPGDGIEPGEVMDDQPALEERDPNHTATLDGDFSSTNEPGRLSGFNLRTESEIQLTNGMPDVFSENDTNNETRLIEPDDANEITGLVMETHC
ncbi:unnamed protein product, partial [Darwinula stevensoni]